MRNYCARCEDTLIDPLEFRYGYCLWCVAIMLEQMDERLADLYYDGMDEGEI